MLLYLLILFGSGLAAPADEFADLAGDKDLTFNDEKYVRNIVPARFSSHHNDITDSLHLSEVIDEDTAIYKSLNKYIEKGYLKKGMSFNVYDENINAAIQALFDVMQSVKTDQLEAFKSWAKRHINEEMFDYASRVNFLFSSDQILNTLIHKEPTFLKKPNYYVNSEVIFKALEIKLGLFSEDEEEVNGIERYDDAVVIKSQQAGWNLPNNGCDEELSYFREDIGLNSFYYSVHLMHPFWMPNYVMDKVDPRHAERYYFVHQQLLARYFLEREHLNADYHPITVDCKNTYNPYLVHDNGLPFPSTEKSSNIIETEKTAIKQVDILLRECISRRVVISDAGTIKNISEVDDMNTIARFILKKIDSREMGQKIRDVYGGQPKADFMNNYNPAPSALFNYQTALRDTIYWGILDYAMSYFKEYKSVMAPFDLTPYNEEDIKIDSKASTKLTTRIDDYQFSLSSLFNNCDKCSKSTADIQVRQKRLTYVNFDLNFNVYSNHLYQKVQVKIFIGPYCNSATSCWDQYDRFFQLASFDMTLYNGLNTINWDPDTERKYSFDNYYNLKQNNSIENRYNSFLFPSHLLLPKGTEKGLKMTVFLIVTSVKTEDMKANMKKESGPDRYYNQVVLDYNSNNKPLGFPFHRAAINYVDEATNYKFFNVTVYHEN